MCSGGAQVVAWKELSFRLLQSHGSQEWQRPWPPPWPVKCCSLCGLCMAAGFIKVAGECRERSRSGFSIAVGDCLVYACAPALGLEQENASTACALRTQPGGGRVL